MVTDTRAILRALKATGPTTPTGQYGTVTTPEIASGPSPLVASYNEWTSGHASGTNAALPRDWQTFLSGMFGPLAPIRPSPVDVPEPGQDRATPRRWQYPVGWDMPMGMPGTEGLGKLADFRTLRTLADLYSVARACIELRKAELRGVRWDIALTRDAAKSLRGNHTGMADFSTRRARAVKFFQRPDPDYDDFSSWFDAILEEVFVTDALALYIHPARTKGKGLLGSHVGALDLLDGSLIRPLVDIRGGRPHPPNPAFQQYEYGVPRVDLTTLLTEDDQPGLLAEYSGDQLLYLPYTKRTWTPYGQAPIERAIIPVMTGLNKQQFQMNFFQEGTIPGLFVSPGDMNMTPAQIRELQDALNALAGDQAWKHKIIVLPGGSKVDPQKPVALADQFDEIVMVQVCMAFSVMPMELGISPRVSTTQSTGAANQMAKASQDIQERRGTVPLLMWLKTAVFDRILQDVCGNEDLEWTWEGLEEDEDAETLTNLLVQQISSGMRSIDEARAELGLDPWNLPATSDPGWATQMNGFLPFTANPAVDPVLQHQLASQQLSQAQTQTEAAQAAARAAGQSPAPGQPGKQPPPGKPPPAGGKPPAGQPPKALPPGHGKPATRAPAGAGTRNSPSVPGTPAHAAASAGTTSAATRKPAAKTMDRELGLLRNHLRKGGAAAAWQRRELPSAILAAIEEDLGKGLTPDEACDTARALLPKSATEITGHDGHADATHHVYAYLARHYPASVLEWVLKARWHGPVTVPLDRVNMARRNQSARNPAKVEEIRVHAQAGGHLDPVVLVSLPAGGEYQIADGWHRTLALEHAGKTSTLAYIGDVDTGSGPWDGEMNARKLNKTDGEFGDPVAGGDGGPKVPYWPGWDHDQELAAQYATRFARELYAAVPAGDLAHAWLTGPGQPATGKTRRRKVLPVQWLIDAGFTTAVAEIVHQLLQDLWADGWNLGRDAAARLLAGIVGAATAQQIALAVAEGDVAALERLIAANEARIQGIIATRIAQIAAILAQATQPGSGGPQDESQLTADIQAALGSRDAASTVTVTELAWAMAAAALSMYRLAGVATIGWVTAADARVCYVCAGNEDAGLIPVGGTFPSGDDQPPAHPRCRCAVYPG